MADMAANIRSNIAWNVAERYRARLPRSAGSGNSCWSASAILSGMAGLCGRPWEGESNRFMQDGRAGARAEVCAGYTRWVPENSKNTIHWCTFAASVFAEIAPYNFMVFTEPVGGLVLTVACLVFFGVLSFHTAQLVTYSVRITGGSSLAEVWRDVVGRRSAWIPIASVVFVSAATCVGVATFIGELCGALLPAPLSGLFPTPASFCIVSLAIFPMSVLVTLKDVHSIVTGSILAVLSAVITVSVVVTRAADGSYTAGGRFGPKPPRYLPWLTPKHSPRTTVPPVRMWKLTRDSLQPLCSLSVTFLMHCNAAKYYRELRPGARESYGRGLGLAMAAGMFTVIAFMVAEDWTFNSDSPDGFMGSYSVQDRLVDAARVALAVGLMVCLTLRFCALREALLEFFREQWPACAELFQTVAFQNFLSLALLVLIVGMACNQAGDLNAVNAVRSTVGALLVYVIPCILFLRTSKKYVLYHRVFCGQRVAVTAVGMVGLALAVMSFLVHSDPTL